jgi:site-specific DNA-methyltransferase (adenine-specific)
MPRIGQRRRIDLYQGDCLEILKTIPDSVFDSLVTDPPAGIDFMGLHWDSDKGSPEKWIEWLTLVMRECHRVLKPGAHCLVWALPRISHRTATAIEAAGFDIRDIVSHLFGQGFPKSLDVSRAIDKSAGEPRIAGTVKSGRRASTYRQDAWTLENWGTVQPVHVPTSDDAKRWQGFGTGLKPACEFYILARKPLSEKSVAANVLKWGTGALNIDGCRIACAGGSPSVGRRQGKYSGHPGEPGFISRTSPKRYATARPGEQLGRFPANVVLSHDCNGDCTPDCPVAMLDRQSGQLTSGHGCIKRASAGKSKNCYRADSRRSGQEIPTYGDTGGASRFFYVAKASRRERNMGEVENKHPTVKNLALMSLSVPSGDSTGWCGAGLLYGHRFYGHGGCAGRFLLYRHRNLW